MDIAKFDKVTRSFAVSKSDMANQLPTLVLLEDGLEYRRFPPIDEETGKVGRVISYKEREIYKFLQLETRFLAS